MSPVIVLNSNLGILVRRTEGWLAYFTIAEDTGSEFDVGKLGIHGISRLSTTLLSTD